MSPHLELLVRLEEILRARAEVRLEQALGFGELLVALGEIAAECAVVGEEPRDGEATFHLSPEIEAVDRLL